MRRWGWALAAAVAWLVTRGAAGAVRFGPALAARPPTALERDLLQTAGILGAWDDPVRVVPAATWAQLYPTSPPTWTLADDGSIDVVDAHLESLRFTSGVAF